MKSAIKTIVLFTILTLHMGESIGQNQDFDLDLFVQNLFQVQDQDVEYEDIYEALFQYYRTPLNINKAEKSELEALFVLSPIQVDELIKYRQSYGPFLSLYELQAVPNISLNTIYQILPFVSLGNQRLDARTFKQRLLEADNHNFIYRIEQTVEPMKGFEEGQENGFRGSREKQYLRYRLRSYRDFSFGFTAEKDVGEKFAWDPPKNTYISDFFSWHAYLENRGFIKKLSIGDYQLQFGQGLMFSSGFTFGKGAETVLTTKRNELGLRPYTSSLEFGFLRGIAATLKFRDFEFTPFISYRKRDGNIQSEFDSLDNTETFFTSFQETGFHRTASELERKAQVAEFISGGNVKWQHTKGSIGVSAMHQNFDQTLNPDERIYNTYEFRGKENQLISANYDWQIQNFTLFGEVARSSSGGVGAIQGVIASISNKAEMALHYRKFDRNFHSFYAAALSESTRNINEEGFYSGFKYVANRKWTFSTYLDFFRFPWLKFGVNAPSSGNESLLRIQHNIKKSTQIYVQYRQQNKEVNGPSGIENIRSIVNQKRQNYLVNFRHKINDAISIQSRLQFSTQNELSKTNGMAMSQDLNITQRKWTFNGRIAFFETDDFDNRQYILEKDVLYAFSAPAYFGRGSRYYLLLKYRVSRKMDCWVRFARTIRQDTQSISSGLTEIDGNTKTDVKFQLRIKL